MTRAEKAALLREIGSERILVKDGPNLDGKFAAFGRVLRGMEVVDAINRAEAENEKPIAPVRITRAGVSRCEK